MNMWKDMNLILNGRARRQISCMLRATMSTSNTSRYQPVGGSRLDPALPHELAELVLRHLSPTDLAASALALPAWTPAVARCVAEPRLWNVHKCAALAFETSGNFQHGTITDITAWSSRRSAISVMHVLPWLPLAATGRHWPPLVFCVPTRPDDPTPRPDDAFPSNQLNQLKSTQSTEINSIN